jgi:hypothetical protein
MLAHKLIFKWLYLQLRVHLLPSSTSLFITIRAFPHYDLIGLVHSIQDDSNAEVAIQKMIEASKKMLDVQSQGTGEAKDGAGAKKSNRKSLISQ